MSKLDKKSQFKNRIQDINIESKATFQAVALFVDKEEFLRWMLKQRQHLDIRKPYKNVEEPLWQWKLDIHENEIRMEALVKDAQKIATELKAPVVMTEYIIQSVFNGRVWREQKLLDFVGPRSRFIETRRAIFPDFTTNVEEIIEAFKTIKDEYKKYGQTIGVTHHSRYVREHFTDYREWYWKRMIGVSSKSIAKNHNEKSEYEITPENVQEGIRKYRKWLKE